MGKRKPLDKQQAREKRNRMLETAAAARLSITEGVREMRAISGMTQEEFARHREVSARVIKALELGQGNPTVATLNQIGSFFGLEVAFVPMTDANTASEETVPEVITTAALSAMLERVKEDIGRQVSEALAGLTRTSPTISSTASGDADKIAGGTRVPAGRRSRTYRP